jgi:CHAT domain-containing protein/tetratricopeptide (TPR) repeat protein
MPSPRPTAHVLLPAMAVLALCAAPAAQRAPASTTVEALIEAGRYAEAEADAARALAQTSPADTDTATGQLIEALLRNGRGHEARTIELAERLVSSQRLRGAGDELAMSLRWLGEALHQSGYYARAIASLREAVAVRERAAEPDVSALAADLEQLVFVLTDEIGRDPKKLDEALTLTERALTIRHQAAEDIGVARALRARGSVWQSKGDFTKARADFEQSLALYEQHQAWHPETALALQRLGEQYWFDGTVVQADATMFRACAMTEGTLRPGHPEIANCLRLQAITKNEVGDQIGARALRERGLAIAEATLGRDHPRVGFFLNDLAISLVDLGDFSTARALYSKAFQTYARRLGPDNGVGTAARYNLAILDTEIGDFAEARRGLELATAAWTRALGPNHANVGRAMSALALVLSRQGRDEEALPYFARALEIRRRALGPQHNQVAVTLSNMAEALERVGRLRLALERSTEAIAIREAGGILLNLPEALVIHAKILARLSQVEMAERAHVRALELRVSLLGPTHPVVAESEVALAAIKARLGKSAESFSRGLRGQRIAREHALLTLGALPERQALEYARTWPKGLDIAMSFATMPPDREAVLDELILGRSLTLDEMSLRRRAASGAEGQDATALWDRLRSARQRFANLVVRGPSGDRREHAMLVDEARREKEDAERALAERSATFRTNTRRATIGLAEVRSALPAGTALVSFSRYDRTVVTLSANTTRAATARTVPSYIAFVLRPGAGEPVGVPLGSAAAVEGEITVWRDELVAGVERQPVDLASAERALRVSGAALRRRIWDPIATHLVGATRVFVVPDSAINLVPFAALPAASGGYLLERGPVIHYLSAERDLATPEPSRPATPGTLLAVGGPAFSTRDVFASAGAKPGVATPGRPEAVIATRGTGMASTCVGFRSMTFNALPAARAEAEEVAKLWTSSRGGVGEPAQTLLGSVASETSFKQLAPGRRVLHLATHGFYLGDECDSAPPQNTRAVGGLTSGSTPAKTAPAGPGRGRRQSLAPENPLLLSGLALAGANRRALAGTDEDDGILTAEEVAGLDLTGLDWAVLSACDTGLGVVRVGEGVLGLRRAFQMAGARTVIMSVWSVEDRSTRQWMRALYQGRFERGLDTADAVHQAALSTLRVRRSATGSGHPFFWAGFVAAGGWR